MNLTMLIIIIIIILPGYFLINHFAKKLFFGDEHLERKTENRYGFQKLDEELKKKPIVRKKVKRRKK